MQTPHALRTPDEILKAALDKEVQARDFYARLALDCRLDYVRQLLLKLQDEETKHVRLIEEMLRKVAAGRDLA